MDRHKKIIKTSIIGIIVNVFLVIFKITIGFISNSIAIILDGINNLTDILSSVVTIVGAKFANKAPDREHPYGHGRIEYISSIMVAFIILFAGLIAIKESFIKIITPGEIDYSIISLIIIFVAIFAKVFLYVYYKKVGKSVNSQTLIASGQDALMDSIISTSTLVAAIINFIFGIAIEGYIGLIIAIFIIRTAIEILRETSNILIGQRPDKELTDKLKQIVNSFDEVQGAYDLTIHNYGPEKTIATVHIQVRDNMQAEEIHALTRTIAYKVYDEFGIIMSIGIYAANDTGEFGEIKKYILDLIKKYKEIKQIHGFYVDKKTNTIYFDLIIDFECSDMEKIKKEIIDILEKEYSEYKFDIILDMDAVD